MRFSPVFNLFFFCILIRGKRPSWLQSGHPSLPHVGTFLPPWGLGAVNGPLCSTHTLIPCTHTAVAAQISSS